MLHWPKKSLVMPFYYINLDQNGPPYQMMIYRDFPSLVELNENYLKSVRGLKACLNYVTANKTKNTGSILDFDLAS